MALKKKKNQVLWYYSKHRYNFEFNPRDKKYIMLMLPLISMKIMRKTTGIMC